MKTFCWLALAALAGGCVVEEHGYAHGRIVVVESGHVHGPSCGHFFYHGDWYYVEGHHHGPGCGHVLRGGIWVVD